MAISFACGNCGKPYRVDEKFAGKKTACKACGTLNVIPFPAGGPTRLGTGTGTGSGTARAPAAAPRGGDDLPAAIPFSDPLAVATPVPTGKAIPTAKPIPTAKAISQPSARAAAPRGRQSPPPGFDAALPPGEDADFMRALEGAAAAEGGAAPPPAPGAMPAAPSARAGAMPPAANACPSCQAPLDPGAVFCVGCGYNLRTGRQAATRVMAAPPGSAPPRPGATPAPGAITGGYGDDDESFPVARFLVFVGIASSLLPLLRVQLRILAVLGPLAPVVGAVLGLVGALIYFFHGKWGRGLVGAGGTVLSLVILITVAMNSGDDEGGTGGADDTAKVAQKDSKGPGKPSPAAPAPAAPDDDLTYNGKPKISVQQAHARSMFAPPPTYQYQRPPDPDATLEFYKPCLKHPDAAVRLAAIDVLRKAVPPKHRAQAAAAIAEAAQDADASVRHAVIQCQSLGAHENTVPVLARALDDSEEAVRRAALAQLAQIRTEPAVDALVARIDRFPDEVRQALAGLGPEFDAKVVAAYKALAGHSDPRVKLAAAAEVVKRDRPAGIELLMGMADDSAPEVRRPAMAQLADLRHEPAMERIAAHLADDAPAVVAALVKFGKPAAPVAAGKLSDGDAKVKLAALQVLKALGAKESLDPVKTLARDDDLAVSAAARDTWRALAPDELTPVAEAIMDFESADARKQARAMEQLATLLPDANRRAVARKLFETAMGQGGQGGGDGQGPGQGGALPALAAKALVKWADTDVKDALLLELKPDADDRRRRVAIGLCAELADARAIGPICDCLAASKDPFACTDALKRYGPAAEDAVIKLLKSDDTIVQSRAIELLVDIGTKKCVPHLANLALNGSFIIKDKARDAARAINLRLSGKA